MAITLSLRPELESRLSAEAGRAGLEPAAYVEQMLERELELQEFDLDAFFALPRAEQDRILRAAVEDAAPLYAADLALPVEERELTAFTALDGEDFLDSD